MSFIKHLRDWYKHFDIWLEYRLGKCDSDLIFQINESYLAISSYLTDHLILLELIQFTLRQLNSVEYSKSESQKDIKFFKKN